MLFFSCSSQKEAESQQVELLQKITPLDSLLKNISFDFEAKKPEAHHKNANEFVAYKDSNDIEITATLRNSSSDTIYFLSTTCEGEQYSLRFDTSTFDYSPKILCNASYPTIIKIAPKGKYVFNADIKNKTNEREIQLGFDFFICKRDTDLSKLSLENILSRPKEQQNILWAKKKKTQ